MYHAANGFGAGCHWHVLCHTFSQPVSLHMYAFIRRVFQLSLPGLFIAAGVFEHALELHMVAAARQIKFKDGKCVPTRCCCCWLGLARGRLVRSRHVGARRVLNCNAREPFLAPCDTCFVITRTTLFYHLSSTELCTGTTEETKLNSKNSAVQPLQPLHVCLRAPPAVASGTRALWLSKHKVWSAQSFFVFTKNGGSSSF